MLKQDAISFFYQRLNQFEVKDTMQNVPQVDQDLSF